MYVANNNMHTECKTSKELCNTFPILIMLYILIWSHNTISATFGGFLSPGDTHPEDITCLATDAGQAYTAYGNIIKAYARGQQVSAKHFLYGVTTESQVSYVSIPSVFSLGVILGIHCFHMKPETVLRFWMPISFHEVFRNGTKVGLLLLQFTALKTSPSHVQV